MNVILPQIGITLHVRSHGRHLADEAMVCNLLRGMLEARAQVVLPHPLIAETECQGGTLYLHRFPQVVEVTWLARPPRPSPLRTSLGMWLRACVAGASPAGSMHSEQDLPALILDPHGLLLLRVQGLAEWVSVRLEACDPQQVRQALVGVLRAKRPFVVTSPYTAEIGDGEVCYLLRLEQNWVSVSRGEREASPPREDWSLQRFLAPALRGRDGQRMTGILPPEVSVPTMVGRSFRKTGRVRPVGQFLSDLWAPDTTILAMSLERRAWVVQAGQLAWYVGLAKGRPAIVGVTDERFDLHRFPNTKVILTEHGDERFRLRIASEWERIVALPAIRRDLDTKFLMQRLKGQRHLVAADFGHIAVVATEEVTAVLRVRQRSAIILSVWPTCLDHPRGVEEAIGIYPMSEEGPAGYVAVAQQV